MTVERGFYQHYKGNTYFVHGLAKVEATLEVVVVYEGMDGKAWTRPVKSFTEVVETTDILGRTDEVPRFRKLPRTSW